MRFKVGFRETKILSPKAVELRDSINRWIRLERYYEELRVGALERIGTLQLELLEALGQEEDQND